MPPLDRQAKMVHYTAEQIAASPYEYDPNLAANAVALAFFSLVLLCQLGFGLWTRQWWFLVSWGIGNIFEVIGYVGRVVSHGDIQNGSAYKMQLAVLILAPAFLSGGIYYLLAKVITVYGEHYSPLPPMMYSAIFIVADLVSIFVQAAGGGIASSGNGNSPKVGAWISVGGIIIQVISITIFMILCLRVVYKIWVDRKTPERYDPTWAHIRRRPLFKYMVPGMIIGTLFIFIRSIYRVVELSEGWNGYLMTTERYFLVLDGLMIFFAEIILTVAHPGFCLGRDPIPVRGLHYKAKAKKVEESSYNPETVETSGTSITTAASTPMKVPDLIQSTQQIV